MHVWIYLLIPYQARQSNIYHVNITRIISLLEIERAIHLLQNLIDCQVFGKKIDNIIATSGLNRQINLEKIFFESENSDFRLKYNREKFPGIFLKSKFGTLILFHSGKIVILGCKKESDIRWLISQIPVIIQEK